MISYPLSAIEYAAVVSFFSYKKWYGNKTTEWSYFYDNFPYC